MTADVRVVGADRLASTLHQFAQSLGDMSDANRAAGESISTAARARVPRRTGRLAGSMRTDVSATDVDVSFGAVHAAPIHWGVGPRVGLRGPHNIAASLFLTTAFAAQEDAIADIYLAAIDQRLGKVQGA